MKNEMKQQLAGATTPELSQLKAQALDRLKKKPGDTEAQEIVDAIDAILKERAEAKPAKVRVKAKNWITVDGVPFQKDQEGEITERQYAALACNFARLAIVGLLCLVTLMASCLGASGAQVSATAGGTLYGWTTFTSAQFTNTLTANITETAKMGVTNTVVKWQDISLMLGFQGDAASTSNMVVTIVRSKDGTTWETTPAFTWTVAHNGTTAVVACTNLDSSFIGAFGYWKIKSIQNTHATVNGTNAWFSWGTKPSRFGF